MSRDIDGKLKVWGIHLSGPAVPAHNYLMTLSHTYQNIESVTKQEK